MTALPDVLRPEDAASLRRIVAEHYGSDIGYAEYLMAIQSGLQQIMPPYPPPAAARWLADNEHRALTEADVWLIDDALCGMLDDAHSSLPAFHPRPHDLPARHGFVVFARPIDVRQIRTGQTHETYRRLFGATDDPFVTAALDQSESTPIPIVAASWRPFTYSSTWTDGGVWFSFYSRRPPPEPIGDQRFDAAVAYARRMTSVPLCVDAECAVAWAPEGAPADKFLIGPETGGTSKLARSVFAAFMIARQSGLVESDTVAAPRAERRRQQRAGMPERPVRLLRLRGHVARARAADAGGRRYDSKRWPVREHWRNQWYPSLKTHRPKLIATYIKGPDGAPLIGGDRVTIVSGGGAA